MYTRLVLPHPRSGQHGSDSSGSAFYTSETPRDVPVTVTAAPTFMLSDSATETGSRLFTLLMTVVGIKD